MRKTEIKTASNADLIAELCKLNVGFEVNKSEKREHGWIVSELAARGVIEDVEAQAMNENFNFMGVTR